MGTDGCNSGMASGIVLRMLMHMFKSGEMKEVVRNEVQGRLAKKCPMWGGTTAPHIYHHSCRVRLFR